MEITLRSADRLDIATLYAISSRAHLASYYDKLIPQAGRTRFEQRYQVSPQVERSFVERFAEYFEDPAMTVLVAVVSGRVVGYTVTQRLVGVLLLSGLFVDPAFQSQGVGSQLFTASLALRDDSEVVRLIVLAENERAKRLYLRHGFRVVGDADQLFFGARQVVMELRAV